MNSRLEERWTGIFAHSEPYVRLRSHLHLNHFILLRNISNLERLSARIILVDIVGEPVFGLYGIFVHGFDHPGELVRVACGGLRNDYDLVYR